MTLKHFDTTDFIVRQHWHVELDIARRSIILSKRMHLSSNWYGGTRLVFDRYRRYKIPRGAKYIGVRKIAIFDPNRRLTWKQYYTRSAYGYCGLLIGSHIAGRS